MGYQCLSGDEVLVQAGLHEAVIVLSTGVVDLPVQYTVPSKEKAAGVSEGTGEDPGTTLHDYRFCG